MQTVLVMRHAHSTANLPESELPVGGTAEDLASRNKDAELTKTGRKQARQSRADVSSCAVIPRLALFAVSQFTRAQQTAKVIGFQESNRNITPVLNEVEHGLPIKTLRAMIADGRIPDSAPRAAEALLAAQPKESIWVTHGLLIAGLCQVLGVAERFELQVPDFCEIRLLQV